MSNNDKNDKDIVSLSFPADDDGAVQALSGAHGAGAGDSKAASPPPAPVDDDDLPSYVVLLQDGPPPARVVGRVPSGHFTGCA